MRTAIASLLRPVEHTGPVDTVLTAVAVGLVGFGVAMVFSASSVTEGA